MKKTAVPLVPFQKATFNVFNVLLLVAVIMGAKVQKIAHNSYNYPIKIGSQENRIYCDAFQFSL